MDKEIKIYKFFVGIILGFLLFASSALAAEMFIETKTAEMGIGQNFRVFVYADTKEEIINAVGAEIKYPNDLLKLEDWSDGNSIINFWVKRPRRAEGLLSFEGVILGAHQSDRGLLLILNFKTLKEGAGIISFGDSSQVLLHDGKGSKAELSFRNLEINISSDILSTPETKEKDREPPEPFQPIISRDKNMFDNQWFLIFRTEDKQSGMDYYEVLEAPQIEIALKPKWKRAESPYFLSDQMLSSVIRVKAVDKQGNARVVEMPSKYPPSLFVWHKSWIVWVSLLLLIILLTMLAYLLWRIYKKIFLEKREQASISRVKKIKIER